MLNIRKSNERGVGEHGWLSSRHTFSFADYYDPQFNGYRDLRVINEDRVAPGQGFGTHGHRDMEILSYVLSGALEHTDSMGNGSVIVPGDVQRMSAGTGVRHSEYNHSKIDPVHFLQIWIQPNERNLPPSYEQKSFSDEDKHGRFCLIASRDGRDGSVTLHQDVNVSAAVLDANGSVSYDRPKGRYLWLQILKGKVDVNGHALSSGDGLSTNDVEVIWVRGLERAEALLFDLD